MAATAVYVDIKRIPTASSTAGDAVSFSNIAATTAAFALAGGLYGVSVKASTFGTVTLQILLPDGTTLATALTAFSADGYATVNLPPGSYKVAVA